MKGILILNDFPINPPDHGGKLRIYNIYRELSSKYKVTYICFCNNKNIIETKITETFSEIKVPKGNVHRNMERLMGKLLGVSVDDIVAMLLCRSNKDLDQIIQKHLLDCEIVVISLPYMFPAIKDCLGDQLLVYESQNVEYALKKSILGEGLLRDHLCSRVKEIEGDLVGESDLIFATSKIDGNKLKEIYGSDIKKIVISPNGADLSTFKPLYKDWKLNKDKIVPQPLAIFLGSGHPPNVEAAMTIVNDIAPRVKDVYFLICGSVCWGIEDEARGKNVGLAYVLSEEEKLELYRVSDLALNPMSSGSGTNIKMLDYMAAGLPVVTTPVGARGLDIESYNQAIISSVQDFPEKIYEVLSDTYLRDKLSLSGRSLVEEKYDWRTIAENMAVTMERRMEMN